MGGPVVLVFYRQLYYTGVQSAGIVMLLAALAGSGFVLTLQSSTPLSSASVQELLASFTAKVLGVVLTLLVIAARSVSAISSELATVQVTGERRSLERQGVNTRRYLLLPRVLAPAIAGSVLYLYFLSTALVVGVLMSDQSFDLWHVVQAFRTLSPADVLMGVLRTGLFAGIALAYVLRFVIRRARRFPDIPLAASNGVFQAMLLMLLLELFYQVLSVLMQSLSAVVQ